MIIKYYCLHFHHHHVPRLEEMGTDAPLCRFYTTLIDWLTDSVGMSCAVIPFLLEKHKKQKKQTNKQSKQKGFKTHAQERRRKENVCVAFCASRSCRTFSFGGVSITLEVEVFEGIVEAGLWPDLKKPTNQVMEEWVCHEEATFSLFSYTHTHLTSSRHRCLLYFHSTSPTLLLSQGSW